MRHYVLASHGRFAQGIYESIQIIIGKQENVHICCGYVDGETDVKEKISSIFNEIPEGEEVIACTDLLGGSVNNELMKYKNRDRFHLVAGMNLPLLINIFLYKDENIDELIERILPEVKSSIVYCNRVQECCEEEF